VSAFETHSFATLEDRPVQIFAPAKHARCKALAEYSGNMMALELNEAAKRALNAYRQLSEIVKEPVSVDCATAQAESDNRILESLDQVSLSTSPSGPAALAP